jgi:hypothetical protein
MKKPLFAFATLLTVFTQEVLAADATIVDVRRNIQLSDSEPVQKDFYLNAGTGAGIKENLVVTATRKISIKDASGSQTFGEAVAPVAQLRIIYANERIAIAREYKAINKEKSPMLEQGGIMIGDQIEIKGSYVDNNYPDVKTASQNSEAVVKQSEEVNAKVETKVNDKVNDKVEAKVETKTDVKDESVKGSSSQEVTKIADQSTTVATTAKVTSNKSN